MLKRRQRKSLELTILGEGGTGVLEASANGAQTLTFSAGGLTITCKSLKLKVGATIKGSKAPNAGTSEETLEYGNCEVEKFAKCEINKESSGTAKITTKAMKGTLAFETKAAAEKEEAPTVTVLEGAAGKEIGQFELSGECPVTGLVKMEGSVVAQNTEGQVHKETHQLTFPEISITKYFVNNANKTEEKKAELKFFGVKATIIGKWNEKVKDKEGGAQEVWGIVN